MPAIVRCIASVAVRSSSPTIADRLARRLARLRERQVLAAEAGADGAVLQHRHVHERLHDLMRAREAETGDAVGLFAR